MQIWGFVFLVNTCHGLNLACLCVFYCAYGLYAVCQIPFRHKICQKLYIFNSLYPPHFIKQQKTRKPAEISMFFKKLIRELPFSIYNSFRLKQ